MALSKKLLVIYQPIAVFGGVCGFRSPSTVIVKGASAGNSGKL